MTPWLKKVLAFFSQGEVQQIHRKKSDTKSVHHTKMTHKKTAPLGVPKVRVVFMGTPSLSATLLRALLDTGYNVVGVVTKQDKPVGRNKEIKGSAVKELALERKLPLLQPEKLDVAAFEALQNWKPDIIIVAAYGKILPPSFLSLPGFGCINFHTSLLPQWRGASPVQNALLAGASKTGVTLMLMDAGMDTGDILTQRALSIQPNDTTATLTESLTKIGTELLLETLPQWIERRLTPVKQNNTEATMCQLIERSDGRIFWTDDAESIYNRFRALTPWPGVFTYIRKKDGLMRLKLIAMSLEKNTTPQPKPLGMVFAVGDAVAVQASNGRIFLKEVQLEGKNPMPIREFLLGNEGLIGSFFE